MKNNNKFLILIITFMIIITGCAKSPVACGDIPTSGVVGQAVSFNSTCSTDASKYEWDFGDGSAKSTDPNPTHTYATIGTYTVKLMAMSSDGKKMSEISKSIKIN